jgi:hypothetical protein
MKQTRKWAQTIVILTMAVATLSCSNELTRSAAPVELVVTNEQTLNTIDLFPLAENCNQNIATVNIRAILKSPIEEVNQQFNNVRITRYRVSYVRTDGGSLVPASFVRSIDLFIEAGGASDLGSFLAFQSEALSQAPFAALLPQNGGRDPETGRTTVRMDVILDLFGETLAGSNVAGRTRIPLDFCYDCNGCS